jgi:hypothetical protein
MRALVAAALLVGCSSDVVVGTRSSDGGVDDTRPPSARVDWTAHLTTASLVSTDDFRAIAIAPDGDVVAAGSSVTSAGATHTDVWIVRLSSKGEKRFSKSHDEQGLNDSASGVVVDPDGFPITVGTIKRSDTQEDLWVRRWTPDLGVSWTATYDDEFHQADFGGGVALDSDRNVIAVGSTSRPGEGRDALVWKLDPTGKTLWKREIIGDAHLDDEAWGVAIDPVDQSIAVAGIETLASGPRGTIWKLDANGNRTTTTAVATTALRAITVRDRTFFACGPSFVGPTPSRTLDGFDARSCAFADDGLALVGNDPSHLRVLDPALADRLDVPLENPTFAVTWSSGAFYVAGSKGSIARISLH